MRRWLSLALIAAIVLASCASEPPSVDWCYIYDLAAGMPSGAVITSGDWIPGVGLAADETGELIVSFSEAFYIEPEYFSLKVVRLDDPGDITVTANVSVFGLDRLISETMPAMLSEAVVTREREDSDPATAGTTVSATMQTTGAIAISQLEVGGFGASPFSSNPCGNPTETPPPSQTPAGETPTPTITPSPTDTPEHTNTPTITPTPTATQFNSCSVEYDFTVHGGDFAAVPYPGSAFGTHGAWTAGVGWQGEFEISNVPANNYIGALSIRLANFPQDIVVSSIEYTFTKTAGNQAPTYIVDQMYLKGVNIRNVRSNTLTSGTHTVTGSWAIDEGDEFWYAHGYHQDSSSPYTSSGSFTLTEMIFYGFCIEPSPTPTQTFTVTPVTPTITNTPNLTHSPTFTRTAIGSGGTGTPSRTPTRTLIAVATWTPGPTNTPQPTLPLPTAPPTFVTATPETYTPVFTYTPLPTGTDGSPGGTPWTTPTVGMGTPWGTPDGWGDAGVNGDDIIPWLQTAVAEVNTLPGSLDPYVPDPDTTEFLGYAKWMISCVSLQELLGTTLSVPACHVIAGLTLMFVVSSAFFSIRIIRAVFGVARFLFSMMVAAVNMILTVVTGLLGMSPLVAIAVAVGVAASVFLASQIDEVEQIVSDVIEIISLIVQIVVGLFVTVISWMFFAVGLVVAIIQSFFTSTPLAIPGFPQCVTNPTGHDICAAWYMLDNTLLGGSVGALIVLIMIVIVDVTVVLWLARKVLAIVNSTEKITSGAA